MDLADRAMDIAVHVHKGQKDRYGKNYIFHPIRIMMRMTSMTEKIVALLHDVVEDSEWTVDQLANDGFPAEITDAVDAISKREGEAYFDYIERLRKNFLAARVKMADLEDNMDLRRIAHIDTETAARLAAYRKAYTLLKKDLNCPEFY